MLSLKFLSRHCSAFLFHSKGIKVLKAQFNMALDLGRPPEGWHLMWHAEGHFLWHLSQIFWTITVIYFSINYSRKPYVKWFICVLAWVVITALGTHQSRLQGTSLEDERILQPGVQSSSKLGTFSIAVSERPNASEATVIWNTCAVDLIILNSQMSSPDHLFPHSFILSFMPTCQLLGTRDEQYSLILSRSQNNRRGAGKQKIEPMWWGPHWAVPKSEGPTEAQTITYILEMQHTSSLRVMQHRTGWGGECYQWCWQWQQRRRGTPAVGTWMACCNRGKVGVTACSQYWMASWDLWLLVYIQWATGNLH